MWLVQLRGVGRGILLKCFMLQSLSPTKTNMPMMLSIGRFLSEVHASSLHVIPDSASGDLDKENGKTTLAKKLAFLVDESSNFGERRPKSRMELKRSIELRIKKRVKEQYINGKFCDLMAKVIAKSETLRDAYNCIRLNSNIELGVETDTTFISNLVEELSSGSFDVNANTFSIATRGPGKERLVLPNLKLKTVQEAIRIVLEVVYRPHFSKISHGCRSGRGHAMALKYIQKEISNPDWWFTLNVNKKLDIVVLSKLLLIMEDKIEDPSLYAFMSSMFGAQVLNLEFGGFPKGHGLPQEGVLSPILINIYLDLFDQEFFRVSMRYETLNQHPHPNQDGSSSNLRSWFRRKLKGDVSKSLGQQYSGPRVHCCRYMDEIFFAVSGSKDLAYDFKSEIVTFLQRCLHLNVDGEMEILRCAGPQGIRFIGTSVRRTTKESPAIRAVHKLKEKVKLFALQKQNAWDTGTVKIGKKWLGHGLKRVKESEIKHLADTTSLLNQISCHRKAGMETDHWYKFMLKIWMQNINAKEVESEENILAKYVAEPSLPQELRDSFYQFKKCAQEYVSSETASTLALLPESGFSNDSVTTTEIIAPVNVLKKCLLRYGLTTSEGYPCKAPFLLMQDNSEIVDWFSGLVLRWLRWYSNCINFNEVMIVVTDYIRKSCIRTLAAKYRMSESETERRFDTELSRIPITSEMDPDVDNEISNNQAVDDDEALTYGISYSGLCLLSLARMVSQSRPCSCFVMGCSAAAPSVYTLHVMERQRFPGWKTGFSTCIHPSLNRRRIGLCKNHLKDLYLGNISLQSINFGAWK